MDDPPLTSWLLFAAGSICAYFLMRTLETEKSAARRASRVCAALTALLLGSLPTSGGAQWQALATIALAALAVILETIALARPRSVTKS
jgi:hypothetical protein